MSNIIGRLFRFAKLSLRRDADLAFDVDLPIDLDQLNSSLAASTLEASCAP